MKKFREAKWSCWKCHQPMIVYTWVGHELGAQSCPIEGRPATIQFRYSKQLGEKYFVNVCPHCQMIQGDFFLYLEPDGPFWGVGL